MVLEKGPEIFSKDSVVAAYERLIAELEQLVGKKECRVADYEERKRKKEVEIALLKNFLGRGV